MKPITVVQMREDSEFHNFLVAVTPEGEVQQVWLSEAIAILRLLWEIYQLLKGKGCFARRVAVARTRKAMAFVTETERTVALEGVLQKLD